MNDIDDLGQDYYAYLSACAAKDERPLTFNAWLVARLNALEDQVRSLFAVLNMQEGDGK